MANRKQATTVIGLAVLRQHLMETVCAVICHLKGARWATRGHYANDLNESRARLTTLLSSMVAYLARSEQNDEHERDIALVFNTLKDTFVTDDGNPVASWRAFCGRDAFLRRTVEDLRRREKTGLLALIQSHIDDVSRLPDPASPGYSHAGAMANFDNVARRIGRATA